MPFPRPTMTLLLLTLPALAHLSAGATAAGPNAARTGRVADALACESRPAKVALAIADCGKPCPPPTPKPALGDTAGPPETPEAVTEIALTGGGGGVLNNKPLSLKLDHLSVKTTAADGRTRTFVLKPDAKVRLNGEPAGFWAVAEAFAGRDAGTPFTAVLVSSCGTWVEFSGAKKQPRRPAVDGPGQAAQPPAPGGGAGWTLVGGAWQRPATPDEVRGLFTIAPAPVAQPACPDGRCR